MISHYIESWSSNVLALILFCALMLGMYASDEHSYYLDLHYPIGVYQLDVDLHLPLCK
jgi:hypothetical protein